MVANEDGVEDPNAKVMENMLFGQRQQMNEIQELLVGLGLNANKEQRVDKNRTREVARESFVNRLIKQHVLNFNDIPCFDGIS
jgi:phosphoribosylformylglycinamidine (FGAM) synthase PurS component